MSFDGQTPLKDALSEDFSAEVLDELTSFGDTTLEELYEHIAYAGSSWFKNFDVISRDTAVQLLDWLKENAPEIGEILPEFYPVTKDSPAPTKKVVKVIENTSPSSALVTKKEFSSVLGQLPAALSGEYGENRSETPASISATNDFAAIDSWLKARAANANTRAQYRNQAERFLLWITMERQKALSSATAEDAAAYYRWLEELGRTSEEEWRTRWRLPQATWIGPKNAPRLSEAWRPFNGPLSPASRKAATTAVRLLFNFLAKTNYLRSNPFDQVSSKVRLLAGEGAPQAFADRSLTTRQWDEILAALDALPENLMKLRLRVILFLGKSLGMRASEMINAKTGWIVERRIGDEEITVIEIVGKGDKIRRLPLSEDATRAINRYLANRGFESYTKAPPTTPLLASLGGNKRSEGGGISRSGLYKALTAFFSKVASDVEEKNPADAEKLRAGSTHWLRHTFAMTALRTMDINIVQSAMGHASIGTTSRYLAPEEAEVARAMKKMKPL